MVDTLSKSERSVRMSLIRGRDTKPELRLRQRLHALGYRFRVNVPELPGKPDLVLPKYKTIIFVHGCFWHGHANCKVANSPKSNTKFWIEKFRQNRLRDRRNSRKLRALGWRVLIVWECGLNSRAQLDRTVARIDSRLQARGDGSEGLLAEVRRR